MRSLPMMAVVAVLPSVATGLGSGSAIAEDVQVITYSEFRTVSDNCSVLYKKLIMNCDEDYRDLDSRKRCYGRARDSYTKCLASQ